MGNKTSNFHTAQSESSLYYNDPLGVYKTQYYENKRKKRTSYKIKQFFKKCGQKCKVFFEKCGYRIKEFFEKCGKHRQKPATEEQVYIPHNEWYY